MRFDKIYAKIESQKGFGIHENMSMNEYGYERKIDENMKLTRKGRKIQRKIAHQKGE